MKKKLIGITIGLIIYTLIIFLIAHFYHDSEYFEMFYYFLMICLLFFIASTLMPETSLNAGKPINQVQYRNLESITNESKFGSFEWWELLIEIYLIIPVVLCLYIYLY